MKLFSLSGLIGTAVLLTIAASCTLAAPSPTVSPPLQPISDETSEPTDGGSSGTTDSPATTTEDPEKKWKEEKIMRDLSGGGKALDELKKVHALLEKSRTYLKRKHSLRKALRSKTQQAADDKKYAELEKWEQTRRQVHAQYLAKHQGKKEESHVSIPKLNSQAGLDPYLYQGDIQLSEAQALSILDLDEADKEGKVAGRPRPAQAPVSEGQRTTKIGWDKPSRAATRSKRQVMNPVANSWNLWPNGDVYYAFDNNVNSTYRTMIKKALTTWSAATCLAFFEDTTHDYTMVFNAVAPGCKSPVGLTQGVKNHTVQLNAPGCMSVGTVAHEVGHNVGMFHTMSRWDRDDTVTVYEDKVDPVKLFNYNKTAENKQQNFGIPYDMGSIMHYDRKAFSINDAQTITWSGPNYEWDQLMGSQNMGPDMQDFKLINELYECDQYCAGQTVTTCYNGGFVKPWGTGKCTTCICPAGVGGTQCQTPAAAGSTSTSYAPPGVTNTCNGTRLTATTSWKSLNGIVGSDTRAGQTKNDYAYCHWWIQAPAGYHMQVEVQSINAPPVFAQCNDGCPFGFTEVRMGNDASDWSLPGRRMCCAEDLQAQFGSTLIFESPSSTGGREAMISAYASIDRQAFSLRYRAVAN